MKSKKVFIALLSIFASAVGVAGLNMAGCKNKETEEEEPPELKAGDEAGVYYYLDGDQEYTITLNDDTGFVLSINSLSEEGYYTLDGTVLSLAGDVTLSAVLDNDTITLTYNNSEMRFYKKVTYRVDFQTNSTDVQVASASVLNGQTVSKPDDPVLSGFVFLGWYADESFTVPYSFGSTEIRSNTTIYARWAQTIPGKSEYTIALDLGYDGAEQLESVQTIGRKLYDLPTPTRAGYTFAGWWISCYEDGSKISYKWTDDTTFAEDDTLFALWKSDTNAEAMLYVTPSQISWDKISVSSKLTITTADGVTVLSESFGATAGNTKEFDFSAQDAGDYVITLTYGDNVVIRYYKNKALDRVSSFTVLQNSVLLFNAVDNAEKYLITVECSNNEHVHTNFDNGLSTNFNFVNCGMNADGIKFTVTAVADGYASSVSKTYIYNRLLGQVSGYHLDEAEQLLTWDAVPYASEYVVTVKAGETETTYNVGSENSFSLKPFSGELAISVVAKTDGYNSPEATSYAYTKQALATPTDIVITANTLSWNEVAGAQSYEVMIGSQLIKADATSLDLTQVNVNWAIGTDYSITVRAVGDNSSYWSDVFDARYYALYSSLKYDNSTLSWRPVIGAEKYEVKVNGNTVSTVTNGVCKSDITLTKSGVNTLSVRFIDGDTESEWVDLNVTAYTITFDTNGGESTAKLYKAVGDKVSLGETTRAGYNFAGWYNVSGGATANGAKYTSTTFKGTADITLYAYWTPKTYTIKLEQGDDGTLASETDATQNVTYTKDYTLPVPTVSDQMKVFRGWCSVSNGNGIMFTDELGVSVNPWNYTNEEITLYAYYIDAIEYEDEGDFYSVKKGDYISQVKNLVIPAEYNGKKVTKINDYAFKNCTNLVTVSLPDTINSVAATAFEGCTSIQSFTVRAEGTVDPVYSSASNGTLIFKNAQAQTEIAAIPLSLTGTYIVPDGVTALGLNTFKGTKFTAVIIPNSVTKISANAFADCTKITTISFNYAGANGQKLTVEDEAFTGCTNLVTINLPARLKEFDGDVSEIFSTFTKLKEINVESTKSNEAYSSIDGVLCNAKADTILYYPIGKTGAYEVPSSVIYIADNAFNSYTTAASAEKSTNVYTKITSLVVHSSVRSIGESAFSKCYALTSVVFKASSTPSTLKIGKKAFYYCTALSTITFEETGALDESGNFVYTTSCGVTEIGEEAFTKCAETEILLPSTLTSIGDNAFKDNTKLSSVDFSHVSSSLEYGDYVFNSCTALKSVELTDNVGRMSFNSVFYKTGLTSVKVSDTNPNYVNGTDGVLYAKVADSDNLAIAYYPDGLTGQYVIPDSVVSIDGGVFLNKENLTSIKITKNIKTIGASAFEGCINLATVEFEDGGTESLSIGNRAFYGCYALETITLPSRTKSIGDFSFGVSSTYSAQQSLKTVNLNTGLETIGESAFAYDRKIESITIPYTVKSIGIRAFNNTNITSLTFASTPENVDAVDLTMGNYVFSFCTGLTEVVLPERLLYIPNDAFYYASGLKKITIPKTVGNTTLDGTDYYGVGDYAFYGCTGLEKIIFTTGGEKDLSFGGYVFQGCSKLAELNLPNRIAGFTGTYDVFAFYTGSNNPNSYSAFTTNANGNAVAVSAINVEEGGQHFSSYNGVLYTANRAEVVFCPVLVEGTVEIAKEATTIRPGAFFMCTKITAIKFQEGGTEDFRLQDSYNTWNNKQTLGVGTTLSSGLVFFGCSSLKSIAFPARLTEIGAYSLASYSSYVLTTSDGVKTYPYALNVEEITFAAGCKLTTIGQNAFDSMFNLTSIILPDLLTTVGANAFNGCNNLSTITLGKSMDASAASTTVSSLSALNTVNVATGSTLLSTDKNGILYDYDKATLVYCPVGYTGNFEVPATVTTISAKAFANVAGLGAVTFATSTNTTLEIQGSAFEYSGITSIVLPARVSNLATISSTSTYSYAFRGCTQLGTVTFATGYSYATIPGGMFQGCEALKQINLPYQVSLIGAFAFQGCTDLQTVNFGDKNDTDNPSQLVYIGMSAFRGCSSLNNVDIPDTVTMLGASITTTAAPSVALTTSAYTFAECTSLTNIHLPTQITLIPKYTFSGCTALTTINWPTKVTQIGQYAFQNCSSLSSVDLTNITTVEQYAFKGAGLTSLTIPSTLTTLGTYAFQNNLKLTTVSIPTDAFATLPTYSFDGCKLLTSVTFRPASESKTAILTAIGAAAFKGTGLTSVKIPSCVTTINNNAFSGCKSLTTVTIDSSARTTANLSIVDATSGYGAFDGCINLESIDLSYVSVIGAYNFNGCTGLTTVTRVGDHGVATLGQYVFNGCKSLSTVQLENVAFTYLSYGKSKASQNIFDGCTSLTNLAFEKGKEGFTNYIVTSTAITSLPTYMFQGCTSLSSVSLPTSLTTISASAFKNCSALTQFTIPSTVTTIGANAFQYSGLTSITVPSSVTSMSSSVFANCASLTTAVYNSSAFTGTNIFADCPLLSSVTLNDNITHIGQYAFKNCTSLESITLPSKLKQLGINSATATVNGTTSSYTFQGCTALKEISIPDSVTALGLGVFADCTSLERVYLNNVTVLSSYGGTQTSVYMPTFSGCVGTTFTKNDNNTTLKIADDGHSVYINDGLYVYTGSATEFDVLAGTTTIAHKAFEGNTTLETINLPSTITTIGGYAFNGATALKSIDVSNTCNTVSGKTTIYAIGNFAFQNCTSLTTVKLGTGTVHNSAFKGCTALTSIDFGSVTALSGSNIFKGCTSLTSVTIPDSVTNIGMEIFEDCTSLKEATFNCTSNVTTNTLWFNNCTALETVTFADGMKTLGATAFQNCTSLKNVTLPSTLETLGSSGSVFKGCTSLEEITLPEKITAIYSNTFNGCTSLKTVKALGQIKYIADSAFADCVKLTSKGIDLSNVLYIGKLAFQNCTSLTTVSLPNLVGFAAFTSSLPKSVYAVSNQMETFKGCTSLTTVSMPNVTLLQKGLFNGCTALTSVTTGAVTEIGDEVFKDCSSLASYDISSVTSIGANAFEGCTAMTSMTITAKTTTIGASAFAGWTAEQSIAINMLEEEKPSGWSDDWNKDCEATITWGEN